VGITTQDRIDDGIGSVVLASGFAAWTWRRTLFIFCGGFLGEIAPSLPALLRLPSTGIQRSNLSYPLWSAGRHRVRRACCGRSQVPDDRPIRALL